MSAHEDVLPETTRQKLDKLIALGPDYVTTETDIYVLVKAAKAYVHQVAQQRARAEARAVEAKARAKQQAARAPRRTSAAVEAALLKEAMHEAATKAILAARNRWVDLQAEVFTLPDGRKVTWAEATIDDHKARASAQRELAAGIEADAKLHDKAAEDLYTFGVYRLGDLGTLTPREIEQ